MTFVRDENYGNCPECNKKLQLSRNKMGLLFIGCTGYSRSGCRYQQHYIYGTCPSCSKGDIIHVYNKRTTATDYICTECSYKSKHEPVFKQCPECGYDLVWKEDGINDIIVCNDCGSRWKKSEWKQLYGDQSC